MKHLTTHVSLFVAAVITAGPLLVPSTPAKAADEPSVACVQQVALDVLESAPVCFESVAEAEAFATGIHTAGPRSTVVEPYATKVLGRVYTGLNFSGSVLIHSGPTSSCSTSSYLVASLPAGWDNAPLSAKAEGSCWAGFFTGASNTGSQVVCMPICGTFGSFNGEISSVAYRPGS